MFICCSEFVRENLSVHTPQNMIALALIALSFLSELIYIGSYWSHF